MEAVTEGCRQMETVKDPEPDVNLAYNPLQELDLDFWLGISDFGN